MDSDLGEADDVHKVYDCTGSKDRRRAGCGACPHDKHRFGQMSGSQMSVEC